MCAMASQQWFFISSHGQFGTPNLLLPVYWQPRACICVFVYVSYYAEGVSHKLFVYSMEPLQVQLDEPIQLVKEVIYNQNSRYPGIHWLFCMGLIKVWDRRRNSELVAGLPVSAASEHVIYDHIEPPRRQMVSHAKRKECEVCEVCEGTVRVITDDFWCLRVRGSRVQLIIALPRPSWPEDDRSE